MNEVSPRICDYEGSDYRTRFWENQHRDYEDQVERATLRRLLPASGERLLEVGAGFGRLTNAYHMYRRVVLLDYSFSLLQQARQQWGDDRFVYVAADAYRLPFVPGAFDGAAMIRVIHHFEDVPAALAQIRRVMRLGGQFILEYANKRNLKALARYGLGRQGWNPNSLDPVEFVELNYNFHPAYITAALQTAGFTTAQQVPVSFLRLGLLKRMLPTAALVTLDSWMQRTGWLIAPSIFTQNIAAGGTAAQPVDDTALFACPQTGAPLRREGELLTSPNGPRWQIRDGIYDFKQPV